MRRLFTILVLIGLLMSLFVLEVAAEPKPAEGYVPHEVTPGDAEFAETFGFLSFNDLWVELDGVGAELPQTSWEGCPLFPYQVDDFLRGRQRADGGIEGIPIGFTFHYMQGPADLAPGWGAYIPPEGGIEDLPMDWPAVLADEGYNRVYVSTNGFLLFDDPEVQEYTRHPHSGEWYWRGAGNWNWWPWQLPIREPPNNFIAPYWTDLVIGDNSYTKVLRVARVCIFPCPWAVDECCVEEMIPVETITLPRPRGRLLYATVGQEPNRRFIVEWLNARNRNTGNLATFQVQLWEGTSSILFLYKDFQTRDPSETYFESPSVVIGMEDYYGGVKVGTAFTMQGFWIGSMIPGLPSWRDIAMNWIPKAAYDLIPWWIPRWAVFGFHLPQPRAAGDMVGYVY